MKSPVKQINCYRVADIADEFRRLKKPDHLSDSECVRRLIILYNQSRKIRRLVRQMEDGSPSEQENGSGGEM